MPAKVKSASRKLPPSKRPIEDKDSEEYKERRATNNIAVKRSREKARLHQKETNERVQKLRKENGELEQRVKVLGKELSVLKDLFIAHASATGSAQAENEWNSIAAKAETNSDSSRLSSTLDDHSYVNASDHDIKL